MRKVDYRRVVEAKLNVLGTTPGRRPGQRRGGDEMKRGGRLPAGAENAGWSRRSGAALVAVCLGASLGACSLFGPDRPKPKPLPPIVAPITAKQVWNQSIGAVQFSMTMAVNGGVITAASSDGNVLAVEAETGKTLWRATLDSKISAGVGSDGRFAAVVTREGELVVLEAGAGEVAQAARPAHRDGAAGGRRARLRARRRPRSRGLRRPGRQPRSGSCSGPASR